MKIQFLIGGFASLAIVGGSIPALAGGPGPSETTTLKVTNLNVGATSAFYGNTKLQNGKPAETNNRSSYSIGAGWNGAAFSVKSTANQGGAIGEVVFQKGKEGTLEGTLPSMNLLPGVAPGTSGM
jgi:hypothetical protein